MTERDIIVLPEDAYKELLEQKNYLERVLDYYEKEIVKNMPKRKELKKRILESRQKGLDVKSLEDELKTLEQTIDYYIEDTYDVEIELRDINFEIVPYKAGKWREVGRNALRD